MDDKGTSGEVPFNRTFSTTDIDRVKEVKSKRS